MRKPSRLPVSCRTPVTSQAYTGREAKLHELVNTLVEVRATAAECHDYGEPLKTHDLDAILSYVRQGRERQEPL